jgi:hypothetical protein
LTREWQESSQVRFQNNLIIRISLTPSHSQKLYWPTKTLDNLILEVAPQSMIMEVRKSSQMFLEIPTTAMPL